MSSYVRLVIDSNGTSDDFKSQSNLAPLAQAALVNFANYINGLAGGAMIGADLFFKVGAVKASGTITTASTGSTATQTMTIAGVTLTAVASGATNNQFNVSTTPGTQATNIAAAINASTTLAGRVTATAALGVVTVTAEVPGLIGNGLVMANVNLANVTVVNFANGLDGTAYSIREK